MNGWQFEGKRRIFGHGGSGAARLHEAGRLDHRFRNSNHIRPPYRA
jgi:hypothetical protein